MNLNEQQREDQQLMFHPSNIFMVILLTGLAMLFLALTVSYVYTRTVMNVPPIQVPPLFIVNTLILLGSSYTMMRAKKCYLDDDTEGYQRQLKYTIWLSVLFMLMQAFTWYWLFNINEVTLKHSTTAGYLYVISFVHLLHVLAGLPFLYLFLHTAKKHMKDPVTVLVYFSDPEKRLKLRLLTMYWHFLDGLWIYLVLFLLLNLLF
jgi:cytochrome c oxidase subunit III